LIAPPQPQPAGLHPNPQFYGRVTQVLQNGDIEIFPRALIPFLQANPYLERMRRLPFVNRVIIPAGGTLNESSVVNQLIIVRRLTY
jgi:hypothetical protein